MDDVVVHWIFLFISLNFALRFDVTLTERETKKTLATETNDRIFFKRKKRAKEKDVERNNKIKKNYSSKIMGDSDDWTISNT